MTSHEQADPSTRVTRPGDILALVTSARPWSPAVTAGIAIAARWGSNLTGCFIDPALRAHATEPTVLGLLLETRPESADELTAFCALARQAGVPVLMQH